MEFKKGLLVLFAILMPSICFSTTVTENVFFATNRLNEEADSLGRAGFYPQDQENAMYSAHQLMEFLDKLRTQSGLSRIHVIAHSIGSRLLFRVLTLIGMRQNSDNVKPFGKISFLAPDVDEGEFLSWLSEMKMTADRISVYGARDDQALTLSMSLFGLPRLGLFRPGHLISAEGIDTIDVTDENFGIHRTLLFC